jgi:hypothetical protein
MLDANLRPTQRMAVIGAINPQSSAAEVDSGWLPATAFKNYLAILQVGALGANATVDANVMQAQDNAGTGAKAIVPAGGNGGTKSVVQLTAAGNNGNGQCLINLQRDELDFANGFLFIRFQITPAVAASLISGIVLGMDNDYDPPAQAASVEQTIQ